MASLSPTSEQPHTPRRLPVGLLIALAAAGAATAIAFSAGGIGNALRDHTGRSLTFLGATILLQLFAVRLPRGTISVSAVGLIAAGIVLGAGPAMAIAVTTALAQYLRSRGLAHRALLDAANLALSAGSAALVYQHVSNLGGAGSIQLLAALLAGLAYTTVNHALLCLAMGSSEARSPLAVWQERFHWARYHFLAYGPLAILAATAYTELGAVSLVAFAIPPILLAQSMRDHFRRTFRRSAADPSVGRSEIETLAA